VDFSSFTTFLSSLRAELEAKGLGYAWPCFIVAQVGTDLHTSYSIRSPRAACTRPLCRWGL